MGEVYRATDTVLGRTVAVKLLSERHADNPDIRNRFEREALAAARLSGEPNVVTVFDVGEHEGRPFIVMEYLDGGSVDDRLRQGRVEREQALQWLSETARALDSAHAQGVVHRDVKPANLMLDRDETIRVSDFGIASAAGMDTLTLPGTVLGTAGYLSPEQARGEPATAESDRYALGVVAFELLTGRRPYAGETPVTEALAHVNAAIPSASTIDPELPTEVDRVFARALAKNPADRPSSSAELARELRGALEEAVEPTLVTAPAPVAARPPAAVQVRHHRKRPSAMAYAVVAGIVLLVGFGVAAVIGAATGDDPPGRTQPRETTRPTTTTDQTTTSEMTTEETTTREPPSPPPDDGVALANAGFARMQAEDYAGALPLLERAVAALSGVGTLAEAYASYNLAFTRFALGECNGVVELLDRSEQVQGHRSEIDRLRRSVERECDGKPGNGKKDEEEDG